MLRISGFTGNGRITNGRCHECGNSVQIQHGTYPGERWSRHLFWCDTCNRYRLMLPLGGHCADCRAVATESPLYLIRVGGDCIYYHVVHSGYSIEEIEAVKATIRLEPQPVAVQMRLAFGD